MHRQVILKVLEQGTAVFRPLLSFLFIFNNSPSDFPVGCREKGIHRSGSLLPGLIEEATDIFQEMILDLKKADINSIQHRASSIQHIQNGECRLPNDGYRFARRILNPLPALPCTFNLEL